MTDKCLPSKMDKVDKCSGQEKKFYLRVVKWPDRMYYHTKANITDKI